MKIYLAAPWTHKDAARAVATDLTTNGHTITTRWWDHRDVPGYRSPTCSEEEFAELAEQATLDLEGVTMADVFVLLNTGVSEGKAVEMGYALSLGIPIICVGPRSNLFHYCDMVEVVDGVEALLMALDNIEATWRADEAAMDDTFEDWCDERDEF